jgi:hypothetical protein
MIARGLVLLISKDKTLDQWSTRLLVLIASGHNVTFVSEIVLRNFRRRVSYDISITLVVLRFQSPCLYNCFLPPSFVLDVTNHSHQYKAVRRPRDEAQQRYVVEMHITAKPFVSNTATSSDKSHLSTLD